MSNYANNDMTVLANDSKRVAMESISNFARALCESLTDTDIETVFTQLLDIEENVNGGDCESLIEGLQESGFMIDKYGIVEDIDALIDEYVDRGIDSESITTYEVDNGLIVTYSVED